jgi:nicotinamidase-related amidase
MKILILVDCQNDFIDGALRNEEAIKKVDHIVDKIYTTKYDKVFVTYDTHYEDTYFDTLEGKKLPIMHCIYNTEGWFINDDIIDALDNIYYETCDVRKHNFGSIDLCNFIMDYMALYPKEEFEIDMCGFCTDICVVSNALMLKTLCDKIEINVDASCCAGTTIEKHNAALDVMESCQINIINR